MSHFRTSRIILFTLSSTTISKRFSLSKNNNVSGDATNCSKYCMACAFNSGFVNLKAKATGILKNSKFLISSTFSISFSKIGITSQGNLAPVRSLLKLKLKFPDLIYTSCE